MKSMLLVAVALAALLIPGGESRGADRYGLPRTPTYTMPRTPTYTMPTYTMPRLPSPSVTTVSPYFRGNGTYVAPHFRTTPDRSFNNNFSTYPNINPYTGKVGTRAPRGY
jgi:hypothetical protein